MGAASGHYSGGCYCGALRYRIGEPLAPPCFCHCRSCQRASGAPYVGWCTVAADELELLQGVLSEHVSAAGVVRGFCALCGTSISYRHPARRNEVDITLASLDQPALLPAAAHIQLADRHAGVELDGTLPQFSGWRSSR